MRLYYFNRISREFFIRIIIRFVWIGRLWSLGVKVHGKKGL